MDETRRPTGRTPASGVGPEGDLELKLAIPALPIALEVEFSVGDGERFQADFRKFFPQANRGEQHLLEPAMLAMLWHIDQARASTDAESFRRHIRTAGHYAATGRRVLSSVKFRACTRYRRQVLRTKPATTLRQLLRGSQRSLKRRPQECVPHQSRTRSRPSPACVTGAAAGRRSDTSSSSPPSDDDPHDEPRPGDPPSRELRSGRREVAR